MLKRVHRDTLQLFVYRQVKHREVNGRREREYRRGSFVQKLTMMCANNHWVLHQTWPGQYKLIPVQGD